MFSCRNILVAAIFIVVGALISKHFEKTIRVSAAMAQGQMVTISNDLSNEEQRARVEKLQLEITALKNPFPIYKTLVEFVPLLTALLTVITLAAGAYKYFDDRKETRLAQDKAQFRADVDQILSFPSESKISLARITFLLHDLGDLTRNDNAARDNVTNIIERLVANDLGFDKLRDVSFDVIAMDHWAGYAARLGQKGSSQDILYKYYQALRHLYDENKKYFSSIDVDKETGGYIVEEYTEEEKFLRFAQLAIGYGRRVRLIQDARERDEAIAKFAEALQNPKLAAKLFDDRP